MRSEGRFISGRRSSPLDLTWPGRFQPELTKRVVNPTAGAAAFLATADGTQRGTDSLSFRTACSLEGTLCSDMSLGTTFAVATDSGLAPATPYQEILWPITEPSVNSAHKFRCMPGPSPPACSTTRGCRRNTTCGKAAHTACCPRQESAVGTIS